MIKLTDISEKLGISTATVSNALSGKGRMKRETRELICRTAEQMGYSVKSRGKHISQKMIVITEALSAVFCDQIISGISSAAIEDGSHFMIYDLSIQARGLDKDATVEQLRPAIDAFLCSLQSPPAGIIYVSQYPRNLNGLFSSTSVPVVSAFCFDKETAVNVNYDDMQGAYAATEHLIREGNKRIAMITGPINSQSMNQRLFGYQSALIDNGIPFDSNLVRIGNWEEASGIALTRKLLSDPQRPDAIFAQNDTMAFGALRAARSLGIKIPSQLSVIGFDNTALSSLSLPRLSSIDPPFHEIGRQSYIQIKRLMNGNTADSTNIVIPCSPVLRETTKQAI